MSPAFLAIFPPGGSTHNNFMRRNVNYLEIDILFALKNEDSYSVQV